MSLTRAPCSISRGAAIALAATGPVAIGAILAAGAHDARPMIAAPAIVFGVVAATAPALYIATAAAGQAPPLAAMVRAFGVALGAFGVALAGLILPAAFAALSSVSSATAIAAPSAAIAAAGLLGLRRLASELLGLAIVRSVALGHGGSVGVDCAGGTTAFWIELPISRS